LRHASGRDVPDAAVVNDAVRGRNLLRRRQFATGLGLRYAAGRRRIFIEFPRD
jgi:hypothetical protein